MLVPAIPFRKNSFRAGAKYSRETRAFEQLAELARSRAAQEAEGRRGREGAVPE